MKLRKLNGNDIFKMSRILKKIDFNIDMSGVTVGSKIPNLCK